MFIEKRQENGDLDTPNMLEFSMTVFYLARYAECLEIDKTISVPDERELFYLIYDWAMEFERTFDRKQDHQSQLEEMGYHWLLNTFPYNPDLDDDLAQESYQERDRQDALEKTDSMVLG